MSDAFCTNCGEPLGEDDKFCAQCGKARSAPAEEKQPVGGKGVPVTLSLVVAIAIAGVSMFFVFGTVFGGGSVEGTLTATGGPHGDFRFVPDGCQSMQPFGRAGANVHGVGPNDGGVYVSADPIMGYRVDVEVPGSCKNADGTDCTVFEVPRDRCGTWDVEAVFNGTVVNDVRQYRGHARLSCLLDDGTKIEADLTYGGC